MKRYCISTFASPGTLFPYSKCRYFLVQKAKDAETIGIVVGTLGVGKLNANNRNYTNSNNGGFCSFLLKYHRSLEKNHSSFWTQIILVCYGQIECSKDGKFHGN